MGWQRAYCAAALKYASERLERLSHGNIVDLRGECPLLLGIVRKKRPNAARSPKSLGNAPYVSSAIAGHKLLFGMGVPGNQGRNQLDKRYTAKFPQDPYFSIKTRDRLFLTGDHQHVYYFKTLPKGAIAFVMDGHFVGPYKSIRRFWCTQDGHYAYIRNLQKSQRRAPQISECVVDGKVVARTDVKEATLGSICLSSDGRRYAYRTTRKGKAYVICEGREFGPFAKRPLASFGFTPYGKHFWIEAHHGSYTSSCFYDGQELVHCPLPVNVSGISIQKPPTDLSITLRRFVFSPDGNRMAFCAVSPDATQTRINPQTGQVVVIDGNISSVYDELQIPVFSPDSRHVAFWASRGRVRSADKFIVLDGREIPVGPASILEENLMAFSPNSKDLWYCSNSGDSWIVRNDEYVCRAKYMPLAACNFSEDGRHLIYSSDSSPNALWINGTQIELSGGSYRMPPGLRPHLALKQVDRDTLCMFVYAYGHLKRATINLAQLGED